MRKNKWSDIRIMEWSVEVFPGLRCEKQIKKLEEELCEAEAEYGKNGKDGLKKWRTCPLWQQFWNIVLGLKSEP